MSPKKPPEQKGRKKKPQPEDALRAHMARGAHRQKAQLRSKQPKQAGVAGDTRPREMGGNEASRASWGLGSHSEDSRFSPRARV